MPIRTELSLLLLALAPLTAMAQDAPPTNFADHVEPILRERCLSCHKGSRAKNGLDLRSVASVLTGGSSGPAIVPGDSSQSILYLAASRQREPFMPPMGEPLTEAQLETLRAWIDGGALATADGVPAGDIAAPAAATFVPPPPAAGAAVMPEHVPTQPLWWTERNNAVRALAAAPVAPLVAVAGHQQVSLYELPGGELRGVLDFPEGVVHSLRFSASGALLVAGGGRGATSGLAVGWDIRTGERVFAVGDEPDVALAADVSADHRLVALGGPDRVVRTHETATGALAWEATSHTDWITALAFSPDGVLLATADRAGGVFVWESLTGREFHALPGQSAAVTALDWRADSNVLAVAGEDGGVRLFEMESGRQRRRWAAHDGVLDVAFLRDGRLVTCGRDGRAEVRDQGGKRLARSGQYARPTTALCATADGTHAIVGDFGGTVRAIALDGGAEVAELRANPRTDEERALEEARKTVAFLEQDVPQRAPRRDAASTARAAALEAAEVAEQIFAEADAAAADSERRAGEHAAAELDARAARERLEASLPEKEAAEASARAELDALASKTAAAEAAVTRAVARAAEAELALGDATTAEARAAAEADLALARELLAGATAFAQLAAARHAEARVVHARYAAELDAWREVAAPAIAAHTTAAEEAIAAAERARARRAESDAALATVEAARRASAEADAALEAVASIVDQGPAELAAAREQLAAAERAWAELAAGIAARGGRVR